MPKRTMVVLEIEAVVSRQGSPMVGRTRGEPIVSHEHSVSDLLEQLQSMGMHDAAAHEIWVRFINRVVRTANNKLRNLPRRSIDEEDVAQSAFDAFFRGAKDDQFAKLDDRNDLWQVLAMLTERKAVKAMRRELAQKRGGGKVRGESIFENVLAESHGGGIEAEDAYDEWADYFTRDVRQMLDMLDPLLQQIALLRLEGKNNPAIAQETGLTLRSTERKVRLIKDKWQAELEDH